MTKGELKTAKRLLAERIFLNTVYKKKVTSEMIQNQVCKDYGVKSLQMAEQFYEAWNETEVQEICEVNNG